MQPDSSRRQRLAASCRLSTRARPFCLSRHIHCQLIIQSNLVSYLHSASGHPAAARLVRGHPHLLALVRTGDACPLGRSLLFPPPGPPCVLGRPLSQCRARWLQNSRSLDEMRWRQQGIALRNESLYYACSSFILCHIPAFAWRGVAFVCSHLQQACSRAQSYLAAGTFAILLVQLYYQGAVSTRASTEYRGLSTQQTGTWHHTCTPRRTSFVPLLQCTASRLSAPEPVRRAGTRDCILISPVWLFALSLDIATAASESPEQTQQHSTAQHQEEEKKGPQVDHSLAGQGHEQVR